MPRAALTLLVALLLAGCAATPPDAQDGEDAAPALALRCPEPCEVPIDTSDMRAFEPRVAAHPADPLHLVAVSEQWDATGRRWIHAHASTDGGATWSTVPLPGGPTAGPGHPLAACTYSFDPIVAILADGTVLAGGVAATQAPIGAYRDLFLARSTDGGRTFPETVVLTPSEGPGSQACTALAAARPITKFVDKPYVAARDGIAFASWNGEGGLGFARSDDGGRTWSRLPDLDHPEGAFSAALAAAPAGALYTAFSTFGGSFVEGVHVARFDGAAWNAPVRVAERSDAYADIAVGGGANGSRVWVSYPAGGDEQTPMLAWSDDDGATWSAPVALDAPEAEGWIVPTLAVDPRGVAYSGFFHHLADGTNEYRVAAFHAGGALPPVTVSASPIGFQALGLQLGHYMGIAPLPTGAYAVWVSGSPPDLPTLAAPGTQTADLRGARVVAE